MGFMQTAWKVDEVALHPVHPPVFVFKDFIAQQPTTLVLKEKVWSLTGDSFSVQDTHGRTVISCKGKKMSMRERKVITDAQGRVLFTLRDKFMTILSKQIGEDQNGNEIFRVSSHLGIGSKMSANFTNAATGQPTELTMKGDMRGKSSTISLNGQPIAQIFRQRTAGHILADSQTYFVSVAPGVDLALMAAICISFDEMENDAA